jgi:hypothetical protein
MFSSLVVKPELEHNPFFSNTRPSQFSFSILGMDIPLGSWHLGSSRGVYVFFSIQKSCEFEVPVIVEGIKDKTIYVINK